MAGVNKSMVKVRMEYIGPRGSSPGAFVSSIHCGHVETWSRIGDFPLYGSVRSERSRA